MNSPFTDLSTVQRNKLFNILSVHIYKFKKNEEILPTIKSNNIVCIILEGSAQVINIEYNGNEIISETLTKDSVFGTSISLINTDTCQIIAKEATEIVVIDYNNLLNTNHLNYSYYNIFIRNLFDILSNKSKERNERIRILEKKQIRDKLLEFFDIEYRKAHSRHIYLETSLKNLADYIAVDRSSMFRELKHLKDDRMIEMKNKRITLLYK